MISFPTRSLLRSRNDVKKCVFVIQKEAERGDSASMRVKHRGEVAENDFIKSYFNNLKAICAVLMP